MIGQTRPLDRFGAAATLLICVVWGFNQVVVKGALSEAGPIAQTGIRSAIGCACVIAYAFAARRCVFRIDGTEAAGALARLLFTTEFIVLFESLRWTTAAQTTVFIYAASTRRRSSSRSAPRSCSPTRGQSRSSGAASRSHSSGLQSDSRVGPPAAA
jgi:hypothetical protein